MRTIRSIAQEFIDELSGGEQTADSKEDVRDVALKVKQIANNLLKLEYSKRKQQRDRSHVTQAIGTYTLTIIDGGHDHDYAELPENYLSLPHNRGIVEIKPKNKKVRSLIRRNAPQTSLGIGELNQHLTDSYWVEGRTIVFHDKGAKSKYGEQVTSKIIVPAPDSLGLDDFLPILPEHENVIMKELLNMYGSTNYPQDRKLDDNADLQ